MDLLNSLFQLLCRKIHLQTKLLSRRFSLLPEGLPQPRYTDCCVQKLLLGLLKRMYVDADGVLDEVLGQEER